MSITDSITPLFFQKKFLLIIRFIRSSLKAAEEKIIMLERTICDFIASITDSHCIEFFGRLTSENPQSIFKKV
jgi:dGTP triphosphohydrolase